ncbi:MAG: hypothetical protein Q9215_007786 [Flavoplaca cf. flavocitrina]
MAGIIPSSVGPSILIRSLTGDALVDFNLMKGDVVRHQFNPGYIVLSYLVSFVGCWTTLKLLHRRTSHRGYYNWYLLLAAAVSMGAVAIWAMHFIGNRAITMLDGQPELQIQYSAGYTGGSFFLPICVVSIAFYLLSLPEEVQIIRIAVVGILTGAAVCGMHYLGQGGIANYYVSYEWPYVLGSALIAVTAATVALGIFFYLKHNWTNNWWKRALCAALLAAAVSGMHWVATVGTSYRLRRQARKASGLGRQGTVIIVLCLALGCCITLITFAVIGQRVKSRSAHQAQQVVLASVVFDPDGKLLVTPEGTLPSRKIAKTYLEETYDEIFDIDHPVFSWLYRASHHWPGVVDLIPRMKAHLRSTQEGQSSIPWTCESTSGRTVLNGEEDQVDFGTTFKELFCVAASELAESTQEPLERLGVLFESIMFTGTIDRGQKKKSSSMDDNLSNAEHGQLHSSFGRGQLLFLVRQASRQDALRLQASGFGFAALTNIVPSLAHSMEVSPNELSIQLHQIQRNLSSESMLPSGVHLACYVLRPRVHGRWDVLINRDHKNLLPSVHMTQSSLSSWQTDIVKELDNMTASECYLYLQDRRSHAESQEEAFLAELDNAISSLAGQIDHPLFQEARFLARPFSIPCQTSGSSRNRHKATVMMFRVIADAHYSSPLNGRFEFGSSRLFRAQQHVYPRSPDHGAFARQVHLKFAGLAEAKTSTSLKSGQSSPIRLSSVSAASPTASSIGQSEREPRSRKRHASMADAGSLSKKPTFGNKAHGFFGGIHVQREVSVDINEVEDHPEPGRDIELSPYGAHSEISVAPADIDTFADELMMLMMEERRQQSARHQSSS